MEKKRKHTNRHWLIGCVGALATAILFGNPMSVSAEEIPQEQGNTVAGQNCDLYFLSVGNVILVNENQTTGYTYEGVTFDSQTNTVVLNNADIKADPDQMKREWKNVLDVFTAEAGASGADLTIQLVGENHISYTKPLQKDVHGFGHNIMGVYAFSDVTIQGEGSLDIFCDGDAEKGIRVASTSAFCGNDIFNPTEFRIEGSTVRIDGSKCNVDGAGIGLAGQNNMIVNSGELEITAKGLESPFGFSGIDTSKINDFSAVNTVEFSDSKVTMEGPKGGQYGSVGISLSFGGNLTMRNSDVQMDYSKATGGRAITGNYNGYDAKLTIDNSNFKAIESKNFSGRYTIGFKTLETRGNLSYKGGNSVDSMQDLTKEELFQSVNGEVYRNYNCFSVTSSGESGDVTPGDINEDGNINIFDVVYCQNHITGTTELTGNAFDAADLNGDGVVNIMDLVQLQNKVTTV